MDTESESLPLTRLKGVGPARAASLARLGLATVRDLLFLIPRRLEEPGERASASEAGARVGATVAVRGRLRALRLFRAGRRRSVLSLDLADETGAIRALFFNQPWLFERLRALSTAGTEVELTGRVGTTKQGPALLAPRLGVEATETDAGLLPVYPLSEGLGQTFVRRLVQAALEAEGALLRDPLDETARAELELPSLPEAVEAVHRPTSLAGFERGRARLVFERLLGLQARLARATELAAGAAARPVVLDAAARAALVAGLPFEPTAGQRTVLGEILDDLARTRPMRRLLQGEVGAGKTAVALAACVAVARAGGQAALLAPTELLSEQHLYGLTPSLERFGVRAVLLTGSLRARERRAALEELASGRTGLAIGTHALFSPDVRFARLDLVVIDEQQRFGVAQKRALLEKGRDVHALLMTATPIPRTLALCFYGDLDTSLLRERPPGRGPVETRVLTDDGRDELLGFLDQRASAGERVFWVCPRIEEDAESGASDDGESRAQTASAEAAFAELRAGPLAAFGVELLHGRVPSARRAEHVERFRSGASRVLVATSMVEVGVDVPQATVMVIEGAERFGLAQLHQLRGRVGRSPRPSWCFLVADDEGASERLRFLEQCGDGFAIAEEDLRRRGMGDLAGLRQAGENLEGLADPELDFERVRRARELVRRDPELCRFYLARAPGAELV